MTHRQNIPEYFVKKRNIFLQIAFTTLFAYVFINIYRPFDASNWYDINKWQFLLYSGVMVLSCMLVVIISRIVLYQVSRFKPISVIAYGFLVAGEIIFMAASFALVEDYVLKDGRSFAELFFVAIQNTALILLIPYLISHLFFAFQENKINLEQLKLQRYRKPTQVFIAFRDENGVLRLTLKKSDFLYAESSDNYVIIHYLVGSDKKQFLLRNTLKELEKKLQKHHVVRCHRSYLVHMDKVMLLQKARKGFKIQLNTPEKNILPVSKTYEKQIVEQIDPEQN